MAFILIVAIPSCIPLPNLVPNGQGEDSDMAVFELNIPFPEYDETLTLDETLELTFVDDDFFVQCGANLFVAAGGQALQTFNYTSSGKYRGLSAGDVVGGVTLGNWQPNYIAGVYQDFIYTCVYDSRIVSDQNVIIGIRFRIDGSWHYGWVILYFDTVNFESRQLFIKAVGYNRLPGVNVRVPG